MDKNSTNEASLIDAGLNNSERALGNTKFMQNKSSSYNFVCLSIEKALNKVERNSLQIFNSYGQSCKFKTIFTVIFQIIHNNIIILNLCLSYIKYSFYYFKKCN